MHSQCLWDQKPDKHHKYNINARQGHPEAGAFEAVEMGLGAIAIVVECEGE
jgi:hypothetical protein